MIPERWSSPEDSLCYWSRRRGWWGNLNVFFPSIMRFWCNPKYAKLSGKWFLWGARFIVGWITDYACPQFKLWPYSIRPLLGSLSVRRRKRPSWTIEMIQSSGIERSEAVFIHAGTGKWSHQFEFFPLFSHHAQGHSMTGTGPFTEWTLSIY